MTTRNLRRMYFVCVWATDAAGVLAILALLVEVCGALCGMPGARQNWPVCVWPAAAFLASMQLSWALEEWAYRVLRRRGEYPW